MYYYLSEDELKAICRRSIESLEIWARRLIHEKMTEKYGENFVNTQKEDGSYLINKETRTHIERMLAKEPERAKRAVDTLFMDDIIYFLCHRDLYELLFKEILDYSYPQGCEEVREFLGRLIPIRNSLSHAGSISVRQAEKAICYSNDFIDGIKQYQKERGAEKVWNIPRIIRVTDSLGNVFENATDTHGGQSIFTIPQTLYCGDTYYADIEVDASFAPEQYEIIWGDARHDVAEFNNKTRCTLNLTVRDIAETHILICEIKSKEEYHKYLNYDCKISLFMTVLPGN